MSDPPPKPKPGSLRDRIAAFERPAQQQQPVAPVPRPKPGGVQWRPRVQPHVPAEGGDGHDQSPAPGGEGGGGGGGASASASMSASDARESIRQGGSLKERMAALQGRGGFGGSAPSSSSSPPPPPPPLAQKPKWKPPPQVPVVVSAEGDKDHEEGGIQDTDVNSIAPATATTIATPTTATIATTATSTSAAATTAEEKHDKREEVGEPHVEAEGGGEGEGEGEAKDPEDEERQRRAAIAARMARLGGARVGMAPPGMFGGARPPPPPAKKPELVRAPVVKETEKEKEKNEGEGEGEVQGVNAAVDVGATSSVPSERAETPLADVDAERSPTLSHSRSPPPAMPAPAVPRRTAPPRRKPPKSPIPAPSEEPALVEAAEAEPAGLEKQPDAEQDVLGDVKSLTKEEEKGSEAVAVALPAVGTVAAPGQEHVEAQEETVVEEPEHQEPEQEHEEEDEDTRRRKIAERIAKMGAVNPFALPPPRSMSSDSGAGLASPPASAAAPLRRSSVDSVSSVKSGGVAKRASVGSISSISAGAIPATRSSVDSAKEAELGATMGGPVAGGIPEQDEREESVPEGSDDAMAMSMILERPPPLPPHDVREEAHDLGPAPVLDRSTRPSASVPQATQTQTQTQNQPRELPHRRWSSGYITRPPQSDDEREHDRATIEQGVKDTRDSPPPLPISPRISSTGLCRRFTAEDEHEGQGGEEEPRPLPIPHRPSILSPRPVWTKVPDVVEEEDEHEKDEELDEVKHVLPPPRRPAPLPDSMPPQDLSMKQEQEHEPKPTSAHSDAPLVIPPPERRHSRDDTTHDKPLPHRMSFRQSQPVQARSLESEVMDDEEGDPIDPSIHVPKRASARSGGSSVPSTPTSPIPPVPVVSVHKVDLQDEESREVVDSASTADTEIVRRRTIAERMAKLGGIKFGTAPPLPGARLPPTANAEETEERSELEEKVVEGEGRGEDEQKDVDEDEEEERARKERIATKLAGMGGMRIGMVPPMMGVPSRSAQRPQSLLQTREEAATPVPTPPSPTVAMRGPPARPPPPPLPQDTEWERGSASNSEDGVKVDMEESDMEEVDHEDARMEDEGYEEAEMVAPPPPPRAHPPLSPTQRTRPPVPSTTHVRKASGDTVAAPARGGSGGPSTTSIIQRPRGQSDYVIVDEPQNVEEEEEVPPPPPARPVQRRATRESVTHPPPLPLGSMSDSISSQWELTSVPSGSIGLGTTIADLSSSWTEAGDLTGSRTTLVPPAHAPAESSSSTSAPSSAGLLRLSSDELMAIWGRVGVQVCEAATGLLERSKKAVVGDGTYAGYVDAVLDGVPNAARHGAPHEWGYLVYAQTGTAVVKRVSDIMPGDVVELVDARFKGHKGLQTYSQHVGAAGEALVGVVSEMESKKSKVRVMQANRQVGQPMVESVSYRLEDLKSGTVKVYRVLEA